MVTRRNTRAPQLPQPEDRSKPTQNELILHELDKALSAINVAGVLFNPASTSTPRLCQAATLLRAVQATVRRRKTK